MDCRRLGESGLRVPEIAFGTGTFGGRGPLFGAWGNTTAAEARRMIDICLEHGVTLFDAGTPIEEVLSTLDRLVQVGKVRYVGYPTFRAGSS